MRFTIKAKLLIFAPLVWIVVLGIYSVYIYKERIAQTRRMAVTSASFLSREIIADRQFYASTIVKRAMEAGLAVTSAYHDNEKSIPLPSTYIREISDSLGAEGDVTINITSLYPINPSNAPKDAFQMEALANFDKGSGARFVRFENFNGTESVRYMVPDVATSQMCVDCHNANGGAHRAGYKIGDVMGGLEIIVPIERELSAAMADIWRSIGYAVAVILAMGVVALGFLRWVITSPISNLVDTTKRLAMGDLTASASVKSNDEIGDLGRETNEVVRNLHSMIEDIRRASDEAVDLTGNVRNMSRHVLDGSTKQGASLESIGVNMEEINNSIAEISRFADTLAASVDKGSSSVLELGAGINEIVDNMESLFSSVDETALSTKGMSFSIKEISENIENLSSAVTQVSSSMMRINAKIREVETNAAEASRFSEEVIRDAGSGMDTVESTIDGIRKIKDITRQTTAIINSLFEKIKEIGKILDVIRDVADETNLLALNAAIIAAQSGEYGKSFSVVANEIKDLAERTSTSAKEVSEIIGAVEIEGNRAVKSMEKGFESVEEGVRLSMDAGEGLKKIVSSARRANNSVSEIARASADQAKQSRMAVDAAKKVADMTHRIVTVTQEQAKGSELINKATERMADIAYKVKGSARSQVEANKQITMTIEDVNRLVNYLNDIIREQSRNTMKVMEAMDAVSRVSVENIEKAMKSDKAVEEMVKLNKEMMESVKRFKLKK